MESQLPHANEEQETLTSQHTSHHDEVEHPGEEKKSVFRRFKDKARKLKNTITKHGHGQDQQDDDDDDDDEDDDETVEKPEQLGTPRYDSALGGPDAIVAQPKDNLERPSAIAEDRYTKPVASHDPPPTVPAGSYGTSLSEQSELGDQEVDPEKWKSKFEQPTGMEKEVPFASRARVPTPVTKNTYGTEDAFDSFKNRGQDESQGGLESSTGKSTGMRKVPHAPSGLGSGSFLANDESEVTDLTETTHTGGKEAGLSQVQHSFDKMDIQDSGSERPEDPESLPGDNLAGNQSTQGSNYTEKISSMATSLFGLGSGTDSPKYDSEVTKPTHIGGKEAGLSEAQHSFDKMGERPEHPESLPRDTLAENESTQGSDYTEKISSIPTPLSGLGLDSDPANDETKVSNPTHTGGKEAGHSQDQRSFDKMGIHDSGSERPEHPENLSGDILAGNQSTQGSNYTEKTPSIATTLGLGSGSDPANDETEVTNPTHTGGKEAELSQAQYSFDKMGIDDSGSEHLEQPEILPRDTLAENQSTQGSNYTEKMSSIATPLSGLGLGSGSDPANDETEVTNPTDTGSKEAGLSQAQHSFDKMGIHDSGSERPEHLENLPRDTLAENESTQGSDYTEKISSIPTPLSGLGFGSGSDPANEGLGLGSGLDPANDETEVTNSTYTGGKEAGLSQAQHSFDKMDINDYGSERPEHTENLPRDTLVGDESTQGSDYTEKISSIATPLSGLGLGSDPANDETKVTNPKDTEGKEAGLSQAQHSFNKMGIQDSGSERPENPENLPCDTLAGNESTQGSNYTEKLSSIATPLSGLGFGSGSDPANDETKVTNPTHTGGNEGNKEAGLSQVQHSIDKMGIDDSGTERKRFDPEHPDNLPRDTLAGNQSTQSSSYTGMISSMASSIASKLGYGEQPTTPESHENVKNSGSKTTDHGHSLTDKETETSAPVYGKVPDNDESAL